MVFAINYLAVFVAAIVGFVIGWAWYSPFLFAKPWMESKGETFDPNMKPSMSGMAPSMALAFIQQLVMAYVLAHFAIAFGAVGKTGAVELGLWVWVGFLATTVLGPVLWEKRTWTWYAITAGYLLVVAIAMSLILVLWR